MLSNNVPITFLVERDFLLVSEQIGLNFNKHSMHSLMETVLLHETTCAQRLQISDTNV